MGLISKHLRNLNVEMSIPSINILNYRLFLNNAMCKQITHNTHIYIFISLPSSYNSGVLEYALLMVFIVIEGCSRGKEIFGS